jgi:DNA repair protein RadD
MVQVASIQTIVGRLDQLPEPNLIVFDEAHHIGSASWESVFNRFPRARVLGLTATPWRLDGVGLGRYFDHMVMGPSVADLIANGSLSRYRMFAPSAPDLSDVGTTAGDYQKGALAKAMSKPQVVGDAITHYLQLCRGKRAIAFNAGIENSLRLVDQARACGIPAEHVDGTTPDHQRDGAIERFTRGETLILSNDSLFGEGVDIPAVEAVIDLSPSKSLTKVMQNWGRALRPFEGKEHAYLMDHAGNSLKHGLPDDPREWCLDDREKRKRSAEAEVAIRSCTECFYVYRPAPKCPQCGHVPPVKAREIEVVEGTLTEIKAVPRAKFKEQGKANSLDALIALGRQRGYKSPEFWARRVWASRQGRHAA